eukprot:933434-Pelagomonas_calceolata.AAC.1
MFFFLSCLPTLPACLSVLISPNSQQLVPLQQTYPSSALAHAAAPTQHILHQHWTKDGHQTKVLRQALPAGVHTATDLICGIEAGTLDVQDLLARLQAECAACYCKALTLDDMGLSCIL